MQAREILAQRWNVSAEAWSVTNYKALREDGLEVERWNRLHPTTAARVPLVSRALAGSSGPIVAVTDFMKAVPDQIARFVRQPFIPLGTDGFGRSDTREALRDLFEVDANHIVLAVLAALAATGELKQEIVEEAITEYGIDPNSPDPRVS
jgi:pyruvate dehydrogenase E1 component